ncbi:c-type cytochrome [Desulfuromonas versatilis]|uniref:C-type cytochrome n=1 Tax=Desulfuromonas versatilis TaxID=2802975 RepID=A0ABN6DWQ6_9BACT|nr:c-type cytochrome [Desulfuromonas versatilis]BCR04565.1 c-type cytochrome [Desulfuromonas versatilis]
MRNRFYLAGLLAALLLSAACSKQEESKPAPAVEKAAPAPVEEKAAAAVSEAKEAAEAVAEKAAQGVEHAKEQAHQAFKEVHEAAKEAHADVKTAAGQMVAEAASGGGEAIYSKSCAACHEAGIAGAPKTGDQSAWAARLEKGMEALVKNAINGYQGEAGMMPARGGNPALSDQEVEAAVHYMVEASR